MSPKTSTRREPKRTAWVIIHCEILEAGLYDEMIFHVASSRLKAKQYLAGSEMVMHSWWRVEVHSMDCNEYPEPEIQYFSNSGRPLKSAPEKKAWAAYERWKRRSTASKIKHTWPPSGKQ